MIDSIEQREALSERVHRRDLGETESLRDCLYRTLARDEHMFVEELFEHP